jgi:hypothetical protein
MGSYPCGVIAVNVRRAPVQGRCRYRQSAVLTDFLGGPGMNILAVASGSLAWLPGPTESVQGTNIDARPPRAGSCVERLHFSAGFVSLGRASGRKGLTLAARRSAAVAGHKSLMQYELAAPIGAEFGAESVNPPPRPLRQSLFRYSGCPWLRPALGGSGIFPRHLPVCCVVKKPYLTLFTHEEP